jgi:hypothetical protein
LSNRQAVAAVEKVLTSKCYLHGLVDTFAGCKSLPVDLTNLRSPAVSEFEYNSRTIEA